MPRSLSAYISTHRSFLITLFLPCSTHPRNKETEHQKQQRHLPIRPLSLPGAKLQMRGPFCFDYQGPRWGRDRWGNTNGCLLRPWVKHVQAPNKKKRFLGLRSSEQKPVFFGCRVFWTHSHLLGNKQEKCVLTWKTQCLDLDLDGILRKETF